MKEFLLINKNYTDINPLICGAQKCKPGHSFGPNFREYFLLHYVLSGCGKFTKGNEVKPVNKGQIFVIRPYEITLYQADKTNPWHYAWVGFNSNLDLTSVLNEDIITVPECEHIFTSLINCESLKYAREMYVCSKIHELLSIISEKKAVGEMGTNQYVLKAKNYIESNYVKELNVQQLADYLGLNRSYFSTIFKKFMGVSPQQYIVNFRLEKAANLMTSHKYSPTKAAQSTGYSDFANFSKMFKLKFGKSPRNYKHKG